MASVYSGPSGFLLGRPQPRKPSLETEEKQPPHHRKRRTRLTNGRDVVTHKAHDTATQRIRGRLWRFALVLLQTEDQTRRDARNRLDQKKRSQKNSGQHTAESADVCV